MRAAWLEFQQYASETEKAGVGRMIDMMLVLRKHERIFAEAVKSRGENAGFLNNWQRAKNIQW